MCRFGLAIRGTERRRSRLFATRGDVRRGRLGDGRPGDLVDELAGDLPDGDVTGSRRVVAIAAISAASCVSRSGARPPPRPRRAPGRDGRRAGSRPQ